MGRAVLLLVTVLWGCSSVVRAPPMLDRQTGPEPSRSVPEGTLSAAELQAFITERLGVLAGALEPMCGPACRSLRAQADPELDRLAGLHVGQSRSEFVLLYQPDTLQRMLAYSESLAMWVLAHEMGHYVDIAIAGSELDDAWRLEMSADAVAGCAFVTLGLRLELVRAAMSAGIAPYDSIDGRLDLVCGSDNEHPAWRWELEAFDSGAQLCQSGVVPLERLENEVAELRQYAERAAEKTRASFPALGDLCRWHHLATDLPRRKAHRK